MSRIKLSVDRIILPGFAPAERTAFLEGLNAELRRALADPKTRLLPGHSFHAPVVRLGRLPLSSGPSGSRAFGAHLAGAIGRRLKQ